MNAPFPRKRLYAGLTAGLVLVGIALRVAAARKLPPEQVAALIDVHTEGRQWGLFGEPRVNVLLLNLTLDDQQGK